MFSLRLPLLLISFMMLVDCIPKHVLLIVADDLGYADLGYTGSLINTPNIDALAAAGVKLSSFYVQRACSPTRAALLTGRYNIRYGFQSGVLEGTYNYSLSVAETLLPSFLKRTVTSKSHMVGKYHLGYHTWAHTPTFRGFDSFLGYYDGGQDYYTHHGDTCHGYDLSIAESANCGANCSRIMWEEEGKYSTHLFTSRAVALINAHDPVSDGSLFLYLPFQAVHNPAMVPASYIAPYHFPPRDDDPTDRNVFAGMLSCLDEGIGNITAALRAANMLNDTLIWFQTDNGAPTPACGGAQGGQNHPFRGGKCTLWEGGQRGTAFITGAGITASRAGTTEDAIMHTIDVLPTLIEALGGNATALAAPGFELDGVSQWALLSTGFGPAPRDSVLLEADPFALPVDNHMSDGFSCVGDQHATRYYGVRSQQWKLMIGDPGATFNSTNIGSGWWCTGPPCPANHSNKESIGGPFPVDGVLLYDVVADPAETTDLASANPDVVNRLRNIILNLNATAVSSRGACVAQSDPQQNPKLHNGTCVPWG
jgi:arylsulfatase A-like enzyme